MASILHEFTSKLRLKSIVSSCCFFVIYLKCFLFIAHLPSSLSESDPLSLPIVPNRQITIAMDNISPTKKRKGPEGKVSKVVVWGQAIQKTMSQVIRYMDTDALKEVLKLLQDRAAEHGVELGLAPFRPYCSKCEKPMPYPDLEQDLDEDLHPVLLPLASSNEHKYPHPSVSLPDSSTSLFSFLTPFVL
jgi:hypothetical protein